MIDIETEIKSSSSLLGNFKLPIVCMAYGNIEHPELYIDRLLGMLERNCPVEFKLICYTDKPRKIRPEIEQRDCSAWVEFDQEGIPSYMRKIGLFNSDYMKLDEFIFLDLTLVIRKSLQELFDCAFSCPQDLVIAQDWYYNCYNSSVMRIRPAPMQYIYEAFLSMEQPISIFHGDQDFIHSIVSRRHKQQYVALFHDGLVVSFKKTLKMGWRFPDLAKNIIENSTIVKFHGTPRMHKAFNLTYRVFNLRIKDLLRGNFRSPIDISDLSHHWSGFPAS